MLRRMRRLWRKHLARKTSRVTDARHRGPPTIRCRRLRRHLAPGNPCDAPRHRLEQLVQAKLVLLMWIHGIGCALIGGVGGGAYANDLTWRPELGAAIGPPLSLATLAVCKGTTCLIVLAVLFQRVRIPPCLAALGCAPIPPKQPGGRRPLPFRVLSSQMLKRLICSKLLDLGFGFTLLAALRGAMARSRGRRGHVLKFILGMIAIGIALVDFYGGAVAVGTVGHYIHYLWHKPPDGGLPRTDAGWYSSSEDDSDDEEIVSPLATLLPRGPSAEPTVGPSMRFADPNYAREQQNSSARAYWHADPPAPPDWTVHAASIDAPPPAPSQSAEMPRRGAVEPVWHEHGHSDALAQYYEEEARLLAKLSPAVQHGRPTG